MSKLYNRALLGRGSNPASSQTPILNDGYPVVKIDAESGIDGLQNALFLDSSPAARNIAVVGDSHQGKFSPFAKHWSACFNGVNQYARVSANTADIQLPQSFTIDVWFCLTSNLTYKTSSNTYMGRLLSGTGAGMIELTVSGTTSVPTGIGFGRFGAGTMLSAPGLSIPIGVWHHVALSRDASGRLSIFFNGNRVATVTGSTVLPTAGEAFVSGANVSGWYGYFPGYISNLRVVKGSSLYDPAQTTCQVPTDTLTAVPGTSILAFTKSNFENQVNPSATVAHYNSPRMMPFGPFKNENIEGGSVYFDGNGDYLKTNSSIDLNPENQNFCVETFVYFMPGAANVCFFSKIEGAYPSTFEWVLSLFNGNALNFSVILTGGVTFDLSTTAMIVGGQWYHVAASRKGSVISLFINGIRRVTKTINSGVWVTNSGVTVGKDLETNTNRPLTGFLSNSRFVKGDYVYDPELTTLTVPDSPLTAIAGTSLLLKYENSGVQDLMGIVNVNTRGNARSRTDVRKTGTGAIYFDGTGDYLEVPHQDCLNLSRGDFTIRFWLYLNALPSSSWTVLDKDSVNMVSYPQYAVTVRPDGSIRVLTGNGNGTNPTYTEYLSPVPMAAGTWHHVAFQRKGSRINIYINGVLAVDSAIGVAPINGGKRLQIGGAADGSASSFLNGYLDKLEIIQGQALYSANFTPE